MSEVPPIRRGVIGEFFYAMDDPVAVVGPAGIEMWNPAALARFGKIVEDVVDLDRGIAALFGPAAAQLRDLIAGEGRAVIDCEETLGAIFEVSTVALGGHEGPYKALLFRDVSAERRHETSLRMLNEVARSILAEDNTEKVLLGIVDSAKLLTRASFSALLLLKEGSETETERFVFNAPRHLFPDRLPRVIGLLAVPIQTRKPARIDDIRGHPAGVGIPVEHPPIGPLLAVPIVVGAAVIGEIAVANPPDARTFDDLDEAVLEELALHAAQAVDRAITRDAARTLDEERRSMLDILRHDIATPVATAKGVSQLLSGQIDDLRPDQRTELLSALTRAVESIERLTRNLTADARLERAEEETQVLAAIDTRALLDELEADLATLAAQKDVAFHVATENDVPERFYGVRLLVRQALENLVTNALKFSPGGTRVALTARREGSSVRFDVSDQGPGIEPSEQEHLFKRFARTRSGIAMDVTGLGLGLSIVKRVADTHSGTVGVASRRGQGATFWITFPSSQEVARS